MSPLSLRNVLSIHRLFLVYIVIIIMLVSTLSLTNVLERANLFLLDRAFQWRGEQEPREEIAIVAISQRDFELGAPRWPWPRSLMARLVDEISALEPAVIVIDILYTEPTSSETVITKEQFTELQPFLYQVLSGTPVEIRSREGTRKIGPGSPGFDDLTSGFEAATSQDEELAQAVAQALDNGVEVILAANTISSENLVGLTRLYPSLDRVAGDSVGLVGIRLDSDGILRNYIPYGQDERGNFRYALALEGIAKLTGTDLPDKPLSNGDVILGDNRMAKVSDGQMLVNFRGPPGTHPTYDALDVLKGQIDLSDKLQGKIVFIGVTDPSIDDVLPTPFSGTERMAGVEFHAAAADTLLSQNFIHTTPWYVEILLIAILVILAVYSGRFLKPVIGFLGFGGLFVALFVTWFYLFASHDYLLPMASMLIAASFGYVFALTDKVSIEQLEKQQARSMLSRYLAPGVVKEMLKSPDTASLGGSRAEITVLFSDIRGFTSLSENLAPEAVAEILNRYLEVMTEIIFRNEGTIDKFEGDAILAFFGAPQPYEDHAERAVKTAIEMIEQVKYLDESWQEQTQSPLRIGIGIHTGDAFVGNIGSSRRMDYTIIGDTVNLASRLQDLTKEFSASILTSGTTYERVNSLCQCKSLGSVQVKGRLQAVDVFEVHDLIGENSHTQLGDHELSSARP